jgi:hypothetical protein
MAFAHGSKALFYLNGSNVSPYLSSVSLSAELDTADVSVMGNTAKQYVTGLAGGSFSLAGKYDGAIETVMTAAIANPPDIATYLPQGDSSNGTAHPNNVGYPAFGMTGNLTSYEASTDVGDAGTWSANLQGDVGIESGHLGHMMKAETGAGAATAWPLSGGVSTTAGGVLYVQTTAATSLTVFVTESSTFGGAYTSVTNATTAALNGVNAVRIAFTTSMNAYTKINWSGTSGTFVAVLIRK